MSNPKLTQTSVGSLKLQNPLMNASGVHCTSFTDLVDLAQSDLGAFISKTSTESPRYGNPKPRYFHNDKLSLNSMGLPNNGFKFYLNASGKYEIHQYGKPYFMSLSAMDLEKTRETISIISSGSDPSLKVSAIEINLSCPNLIGKGQIAYDFENLPELLDSLLEPLKSSGSSSAVDLVVGLKLPPYFDQDQLATVFEILKPYFEQGLLQFLTLINSPGNCLVIDAEKETTVIHPKKGLGGLGGAGIKPIALANIWQFYNLLKKNDLTRSVKLIGCGGIETGTDVYEYLLAGASLVQIGTQINREGGPKLTSTRILKELKELLTKKRINLEDVVGRLKVLEENDSILNKTK